MHSDLDHPIARRLRDLPTEMTPPTDWASFQTVLVRPPRRPRPPTERRARLAAAAVASVAVAAVVSRFMHSGAPPAIETPPPRAEQMQPVDLHLADAQSEQQAAAWLERMTAEPALVKVGTRAPVTALEDRIAWVDDQLSADSLDAARSSRLAALRRERSRLVDSLIQVRYAESLSASLP
jgi:hypothetical protein